MSTSEQSSFSPSCLLLLQRRHSALIYWCWLNWINSTCSAAATAAGSTVMSAMVLQRCVSCSVHFLPSSSPEFGPRSSRTAAPETDVISFCKQLLIVFQSARKCFRTFLKNVAIVVGVFLSILIFQQKAVHSVHFCFPTSVRIGITHIGIWIFQH